MRVNWEKWGWAFILYGFLVLVPPTIYTVSFCDDWHSFGDMWFATFQFWARIVCFILLLFLAINLLLMIIIKLDDVMEGRKLK